MHLDIPSFAYNILQIWVCRVPAHQDHLHHACAYHHVQLCMYMWVWSSYKWSSCKQQMILIQIILISSCMCVVYDMHMANLRIESDKLSRQSSSWPSSSSWSCSSWPSSSSGWRSSWRRSLGGRLSRFEMGVSASSQQTSNHSLLLRNRLATSQWWWWRWWC